MSSVVEWGQSEIHPKEGIMNMWRLWCHRRNCEENGWFLWDLLEFNRDEFSDQDISDLCVRRSEPGVVFSLIPAPVEDSRC